MEGPGEPLPPELTELEGKVGRRAPAGLVRWLREDPAAGLLRGSPARGQRRGLAEKIKALKLELACLRAVDVEILQQLLAVNEGIEAVKWLLEEKGPLTSHGSSLASSLYSLAESREASRRGSWSSLQDPGEKLDSISVGSYLDTLADELDEYSHGTGEPPGPARPEQDWARSDLDGGLPGKPGAPVSEAAQDKCRADPERPRLEHPPARPAQGQSAREPGRTTQPPQVANGFLGKQGLASEPRKEAPVPPAAGEKLSQGGPAPTAWQNGRAALENGRLGRQRRLECDAHRRWVQAQDDVTFL